MFVLDRRGGGAPQGLAAPAGALFRERKLCRAGCYLPQVAPDVGEVAAAVGRHRGVLREGVPGVERQRRPAVAETEADPVVILLLDRPAETLAVEPPRARQVSDAERDDGYVWVHRLPGLQLNGASIG